jgi:hypothetical protein
MRASEKGQKGGVWSMEDDQRRCVEMCPQPLQITRCRKHIPCALQSKSKRATISGRRMRANALMGYIKMQIIADTSKIDWKRGNKTENDEMRELAYASTATEGCTLALHSFALAGHEAGGAAIYKLGNAPLSPLSLVFISTDPWHITNAHQARHRMPVHLAHRAHSRTGFSVLCRRLRHYQILVPEVRSSRAQ